MGRYGFKSKKHRFNNKELSIKEIKYYKSFLLSVYWQRVRLLILERDNFQCVKCSNLKYLQVHHLTYKNHCWEHLHLEDLITVCSNCHKKIHKLV